MNTEFISPLAETKNETKKNYETRLTHLNHIKKQLEKKKNELEEQKKIEIFNTKTGIGEDKEGNSLGRLIVSVQRAKDMKCGKNNFYAQVFIDPETACFDHTMRKTTTVYDTSFPNWDKTFIFSPILSRAASVRVQIIQTGNFRSDSIVGEIQISFSKLLNQDLIEDWFEIKSENKIIGELLLKLKFKFSDILPKQLEIAALTKEYNELERSIQSLETELQHDLDIPQEDDIEIPRQRNWSVSLDKVDLSSAVKSDYLDDDGVIRRKNNKKEHASKSKIEFLKKKVRNMNTTKEKAVKWLIPDQVPESKIFKMLSTKSINVKSEDPESISIKEPMVANVKLSSWLLPSDPLENPLLYTKKIAEARVSVPLEQESKKGDEQPSVQTA